jgi:hypothetical protein
MMDINELRQRIEQIMGIMIREHHMSEEEWDSMYAVSQAEDVHLTNLKVHAEFLTASSKRVMIPVWQGNGRVVVWEPSITVTVSSSTDDSLHENSLNEQSLKENLNTDETVTNETIGERELYRLYQLLELLLPSVTGMQPIVVAAPVSGSEQEARELGQWLVRQLSLRSLAVDIPEDMAIRRRLQRAMVPFVLLADSLPSGTLHPKQLGKLLSSYFDRTVLLIPLQENEWLILANHGLIEDEDKMEPESISSRGVRSTSIEEKSSNKASASRSSNSSHNKEARESAREGWDSIGEGEDTEEDLLTAFALGLHELVASEWVGSFHISVGLPLHPLHGLAQTVSQLRETIHLGRMFHVTEHIHLPWELRLESLLYRIPEEERLRFVEAADRYSQLFDDAETVATLETFFKMDCNVSETAKQLYIHRNTLLYRLDRIKQDTQLDVRRFEDAVLMRLTLLLYKVTKS